MISFSDAYQKLAYIPFQKAKSILKNDEDAYDIVQHIFSHKVAPFLRQHPSATLEDVGRWLYVVSRNLSIDAYQRGKKFPEISIDTPSICLVHHSNTEINMYTKEILATLPKMERDVIMGKYYFEFTWEQLSRQLGKPVGKIRNIAKKASKALLKLQADSKGGGHAKI